MTSDWGLKLAACAVVCSPCLFGLLLPKNFMKRHTYYVLTFSVVCILGPVFFELLPELLIHAGGKLNPPPEGTPAGHHNNDLNKEQAMLLSGLIIAGLIFGGLMEALIHGLSPHGCEHGHGHGHGHAHGECHHGHAHGHGHSHKNVHGDEMAVLEEKAHEHHHHHKEGAAQVAGPVIKIIERDCEEQAAIDARRSSLEGVTTSPTKRLFGLPSLMVLDLFARLLHHICDGVVLGCQGGSEAIWSMCLALAAHEIGHSMGGVGLYISLGVGKRVAVAAVALIMIIPTYIGLCMGIVIKEYAANVDVFMVPIAIGIMLYIALVDLLPALNNLNPNKKQKIGGVCIVVATLTAIFLVAMFCGHSHDTTGGCCGHNNAPATTENLAAAGTTAAECLHCPLHCPDCPGDCGHDHSAQATENVAATPGEGGGGQVAAAGTSAAGCPGDCGHDHSAPATENLAATPGEGGGGQDHSGPAPENVEAAGTSATGDCGHENHAPAPETVTASARDGKVAAAVPGHVSPENLCGGCECPSGCNHKHNRNAFQ